MNILDEAITPAAKAALQAYSKIENGETLQENKLGYLYFLREDGSSNIKIGVGRNVQGRIYTLQTGNPRILSEYYATLCDMRCEKIVHAYFDYHKVSREWFNHSWHMEIFPETDEDFRDFMGLWPEDPLTCAHMAFILSTMDMQWCGEESKELEIKLLGRRLKQ